MNRDRFTIGDWVLVTAESTIMRAYGGPTGAKREIQKWCAPEPWLGQIVGAAIRFTGNISYNGEYGASFTIGGTIPVWLVRQGMTNKPVMVQDADLEPAEGNTHLPWRHCNQTPWSDRDREWLRKEAAAWPRDEKGRWRKGR